MPQKAQIILPLQYPSHRLINLLLVDLAALHSLDHLRNLRLEVGGDNHVIAGLYRHHSGGLVAGVSGYRIHGQEQVDRLQQILFYRALEVPLEEIKQMLDDRHFDRYTALQQHLQVLTEKKTRLEGLIATIEKTIRAMEGEYPMKDKEKFEGLKQQVLAENRAKYGKELDEKYGAVQMAASEEKVANMSQEQWNAQKAEEWEIASLLKEAMELGDPACVQAQRACDLHRQWLCRVWPDGTYTKDAHRMMGEMYVGDERFRAYYEAIAPGCAAFFRDALNRYCA